MKNILLLGAGKSSSFLINALKELAIENIWQVVIADRGLTHTKSNIGDHPLVATLQIDIIENEIERIALIKQADVVISLLPPSLHIVVAKDCIKYKKHFITASYTDEQIKALQPDIEESGVLFLYEMGLDPGIDHIYAMNLIDKIHAENGKIASFKSHCGGLIAFENDNNPWQYKISWNSRNVVLAGKDGAIYKSDNEILSINHIQPFLMIVRL